MNTETTRPYLPATGQHRLLRFYDAFTWLAGARAAQQQLVAQAAIGPAHHVLEIGAGTGVVLVEAKRAVPTATFTGLDPDARALALAGRRAAAEGLELGLDVGYADDLPQPDGSVDRVLSSFMVHHLPGAEKAAALAEAFRVLRPGGSLHLVDIGGGEPGRLGRLLHRRHEHGGHGEPGRRPETVPAGSGASCTDVTSTGGTGSPGGARRRCPPSGSSPCCATPASRRPPSWGSGARWWVR